MSTPTERAKHLRKLAGDSPEAVDPAELRDLLDRHEPQVVGPATTALLHLVAEDPSAGVPAVESLATHLGRPAIGFEEHILRCLTGIASEHPEAVVPHADDVAALVSKGSDLTDPALACLAELAEADPSVGHDLTPTLATLVDADEQLVRERAVFLLSRIASVHPAEVAPVVPDAVNGLAHRSATFQQNALAAVGQVASSFPGAASAAVMAVAATLDADDPTVRANAVGVLGDVAQTHPDDVVPTAGDIVALLDETDTYVRANAAATVAQLAAADPDPVSDAVPALVEALDASDAWPRRNASDALGHLGATVAVPTLSRLAEEDPDERVRESAMAALERIE